MLGKLLKHDFKATGRVMLPMYLLLVIVTVLGSVLLGSRLLQRGVLMPLVVIMFVAYILMLVAIGIITMVYQIVYFYRSLFTAQGYLSFTLPVSSWSLLHSRAIVGFVWNLISSVSVVASGIVLIGAQMGFDNLGIALKSLFVVDTVINTGKGPTTIISAPALFGYTPVQFILLMVFFVLVTCFYNIATGYGSVALGQLNPRHKVAGAVMAYLCIYMAVQLIMGGIVFAVSLRPFIGLATSEAELAVEQISEISQSIYQPLFPLVMLIYIVIAAGLYIASGIIMKKKVNLD